MSAIPEIVHIICYTQSASDSPGSAEIEIQLKQALLTSILILLKCFKEELDRTKPDEPSHNHSLCADIGTQCTPSIVPLLDHFFRWLLAI